MFYYTTYTVYQEGRYFYPNVLLSEGQEPGPKDVIKLRYLRQGTERIFGDNSVDHYKMDVTPVRRIKSTIPELTLEVEDTMKRRGSWNGIWYTDEYYRHFVSGTNHFTYWYSNRRIYDDPWRSSDNYTSCGVCEGKYEYSYFFGPSFLRYEREATRYNGGTSEDYYPDVSHLAWDFRGRDVPTGTVEVVWSEVPPPYYWRDHMNQLFAEEVIQSTDVAALSECIRNTIQEYTTYDTNGYQNMISYLQLLNAARKLEIGDLLKESQQCWKDLLIATGNTIVDDPVEAKKVARRALRKRTVKGAADAWLKYRYVYNTTKADYEQYVRAKVGEYLGTLDQNRVLRGSIDIGGGKLKVKMRLHDNSAANFDKFLISGNQYGVFPGLYNLWDMIPFSFIADWFSNLGDYLQDIDQSIFFRYYKVDELLVTRERSYRKDQVWGGTSYKMYSREFLAEMPQWEIYEDPKGPSGRTIFKRCLDGVSIVSGFL